MNQANAALHYDQTGLDLTEHSEADGGPKLKAFWDTTGKVWTCGYGHTKGVGPTTTCDAALAQQWLLSDVAAAVYAVKHYVEIPLTQNEFDALVDFTFNVGEGNLANSTLLKCINSRDYIGALAEFSRWDKSGGIVLQGLRSRRRAEAILFALGTNFQAQNPNI
jgi:lysozyme